MLRQIDSPKRSENHNNLQEKSRLENRFKLKIRKKHQEQQTLEEMVH